MVESTKLRRSPQKTKLEKLLFNRGITNKQLTRMMLEEFGEVETIQYQNLYSIIVGANRNPSLKSLFRIWKTIGVTPNEIIDYEAMDIKRFL